MTEFPLRRLIGVFFLIWGIAAAAAPNPWPHEISDLEPDPGVRFGRLDNGLRYMVMPNPEPPGRSSIRLFVDAGSLHETESQLGLAHFLEHMAFNGTSRYPAGTLVEYFQSLGMSFGPDTNAYTSFTETVYMIDLPGVDEDDIRKALDVLEDYATGMLLEEDELESERGIILAEERARDSVGFRTLKEEFAFLYEGTTIPDRLPIGTVESIRSLQREEFIRFYDTWYRPDRIVIMAVGAFDPDTTERLIRETFSPMRARAPAVEPPDRGAVRIPDDHAAAVHPEAEASSVRVSIQTIVPEGPRRDTRDERARRIRIGLVSSMINERIDLASKEEGAPFTSGSFRSSHAFDLFRNTAIHLNCKPETWEESLARADRFIRQALEYGFQQAELDTVRADYLNNYERAAQLAPTRQSRSLVSSMISSVSSDVVLTHPETNLEVARPILENVTVDELLATLRELWGDIPRRIFITGNVDPGLTPESALQAYELAHGQPVPPPEDFSIDEFAYTAEDEPGEIVRRRHIEDIDAHQVVFRNGVRLNLKRTDFTAESILVRARIGGGLLTLKNDLPGLDFLASSVFIPGGLRAHSADELRRIHAGLSVGFGFGVGEDAFEFSGNTTPRDLQRQLELLAAYLIHAGYRDDALERTRQRYRESYERRRFLPASALQDSIPRILASGDHRFGMPPLEELLARTPDEVRNWLQPEFDHGALEVTMVGDFDIEIGIELAARTLGRLPQRKLKPSYARERLVVFPDPPPEKTFTFPSRIPSAVALVAWPTDDALDVHRARRFNVLGSILRDRMRRTIREAEGESYSFGAGSTSGTTWAGYGSMSARAEAAPGRAPTVLEQVLKLGDDLARDGIDENELQLTVRPILAQLRDTLRDNSYWLNVVLASSQEHPQRLEWYRNRLEDYESITVEEINVLAAEYLESTRAARFLVIPETAASEEAGVSTD